MLKNLNLEEFVKELSSNSPAPGGGGVAALSSALAASLSAMVFNLTVGKKKYMELLDDQKNAVDEALSSSTVLRDEFLQMMDSDAEAFLKLISYFKLPKETEVEMSFRKQKIEEGYTEAMKVPFELAEKTLKLYDYILVAAKYGNINAVSDAGVAALLNQASLESAILNVRINLSAIKDEKFKEEKELECSRMIDEGNRRKAEVMDLVNSKL